MARREPVHHDGFGLHLAYLSRRAAVARMIKRLLEEAPAAALLVMGLFAISLLVSEGYARFLTLVAGMFLLGIGRGALVGRHYDRQSRDEL